MNTFKVNWSDTSNTHTHSNIHTHTRLAERKRSVFWHFSLAEEAYPIHEWKAYSTYIPTYRNIYERKMSIYSVYIQGQLCIRTWLAAAVSAAVGAHQKQQKLNNNKTSYIFSDRCGVVCLSICVWIIIHTVCV